MRNYSYILRRRIVKKKRRKKQKNSTLYIFSVIGIILIAGLIYIIAFKGRNNDSENASANNNTTKNSENVSDKDAIGEEKTTDSTEYQNKVNFDNFIIPEDIRGLDTEIISLGYDKNNCGRDEYNRPTIIADIQNRYGNKYNSIFVGEGGSKKIYLTFTMGYEYYNGDVSNTEVVMNILKEKNVPAVFFVDGGYVRNNPDMCKKIVDNGFVLGCHGYDHPSEGVATYSLEEQLEDARKIYTAIYDITGVEPYYYRFGSGIWNERALALLNSLGFRNVFYSLTYYDYDVNNQPDRTSTLNMMIDNIHDGEIIYLHTVSNTSVSILEDFIEAARSKGYEFDIP